VNTLSENVDIANFIASAKKLSIIQMSEVLEFLEKLD
jgi:hypothetical protein